MQKRVALLGALSCLALFVGPRAEASYNYSTNVVITAVTNGASGVGTSSSTLNGVTIAFTPESGSRPVPSLNSLNLGNFTVTAAAGTSNVSFTVTITDTVTVVNVPTPGGPGTGTLTFTDTINLSGITNSGGLSGTVTDTGIVIGTGSATIGTIPFTLGPPTGFSSPTINGAGGNVSATINASTGIPAPASLVMFGLGMGALGVVRIRRRFLSA
jgi:hypothetical protein